MGNSSTWIDVYRGFGWLIVPLGANRTPIVKWGRYSENVKTYEDDFAGWVSDGLWENAHGIGVLVEPSGLLVLDIDVHQDDDPIRHLGECLGIPLTPDDIDYGWVRTQSGRCHLYFRRPEQLPDGIDRIPNIGRELAESIRTPLVELKAQRSCVPAPITQTDKGSYEWKRLPYSTASRGFSLAIPEPPSWFWDLVDRATAELRRREQVREERLEQQASAARRMRDRVLEAKQRGEKARIETAEEETLRALRYQERVPTAVEGERHTSLISLAGCLGKAGFSFEAMEAALRRYGQLCDFPEEELVAKILPAARKWESYEPHPIVESLDHVPRIRPVVDVDLEAALEPSGAQDPPAPDVHTAAISTQRSDGAGATATAGEAPTLDVPALPERARLAEDMGADACPWLDEYVTFSRKWSPRAYDGFHESIGLWILSTVAARRVRLAFGNGYYTPLMVLLTARTSIFPKTTTAKIALDVLRAAELDFLLASDNATPQKFLQDRTVRIAPDFDQLPEDRRKRIERRIAFAGQCGWFYDEFGQHLHAMTRRDSHMQDFHGILRRFDDCADEYESSTISRGTDYVERPYLALLGCLTPADLAPFAARGKHMWGDGFWARMMFVCPPDPKARSRARFPDEERDIPESLISPLRLWHKRLGVHEVTIDDVVDANGQPTGEKEVVVDIKDPVQCTMGDGVVDAFYDYNDGLMDLAAAQDDFDLDGNYARFAEKALRVAMLMASLDDTANGTIQLRHWARAQSIMERRRTDLHALVNQVNAKPDAKQDQEERALTRIRKDGAMTAREVGQFLHVSAGEAYTLLTRLEQARELASFETNPKRGKKAVKWQLPGENDGGKA